jgi:hypothetical protein
VPIGPFILQALARVHRVFVEQPLDLRGAQGREEELAVEALGLCVGEGWTEHRAELEHRNGSDAALLFRTHGDKDLTQQMRCVR